MMAASRHPLDHYDITELDDCACRYCDVWRKRRDLVDRARMLFNARRCICRNCAADPKNTIWKCTTYQKAQYAFLAAANRRELWIEMSYHAKFGAEQDGNELMGWLDQKIRSMEVTAKGKSRDGWWALHAERTPLENWFCGFDNFARMKSLARASLECVQVMQ
jgi:hypothetical protein